MSTRIREREENRTSNIEHRTLNVELATGEQPSSAER